MELKKDMSLVQEEIPNARSESPMYLAYEPIIREFVESAWNSARVDGVDAKREAGRMTICAKKLFPNVKVRVRKGNVYLERTE